MRTVMSSSFPRLRPRGRTTGLFRMNCLRKVQFEWRTSIVQRRYLG